ncbi:GNAT family N-acetyltransferase [Nonomuraea sp. NN258]|nr:GNAT family N-acetyltransferase [Nonomuraea antri]
MRPVTEDDAAALLDAYVRNQSHLKRWEPRRNAAFYTLEGQAARLKTMVERQRAEELAAWLLFDGDRVVGAATLNSVVYGPFRNASLGYWLDAGYTGRGLATRAAREALRAADEDLNLHRVEASTLPDNVASRRVLAKVGFVQIGSAPNYLHIDGAWQDCLIFQTILNDRPAL